MHTNTTAATCGAALAFLLVVSLSAAVIVLIISLLLPKQYTATASIMIDPPVAEDPRVSVAVNPTYLESLRSYEMVASSDTLFARALEKFHLRDEFGGAALESIKRHVLKVSEGARHEGHGNLPASL